MISPLIFFVILFSGTIAVLGGHLLSARVHRRRLISLARDWRMHYAADDRFNLAARVAEKLPLAGAADVRIVDLLYGMENGQRRYVFCAHFTQGVVTGKTREVCVASLSELNDEWSELKIAQEQLPLVDQYREVGGREGKEESTKDTKGHE